ncbi:MAG: UDP-glucose/GDP-mannose dehydrogenase family protein [Solirubrobacteraceae bacterium]
MDVCVVGTGYVGLVTGASLAELGNNVICVDIDQKKIQNMKSGIIPIYEPELENIFNKNIKQNRLSFTTNLSEAVNKSSIIFLALPTPPKEDGSADLQHILKVATDLSFIIKEYKVIVNKSTVPIGTVKNVKEVIAKNTNENLFDVISNPEFLREGIAVYDCLNPTRIVIGSSSDKATSLLKELYKPFENKNIPILVMDESSSELTKYASNAFLATKITFMNEIANFCEKVGANIDDVRIGMGADDRIGSKFLFPGIGYGGSCFPKDVKALINQGNQYDFNFQILNSVENVNNYQKTILISSLKDYFKGELKGKNIALWGLSFKPDTDDIREAASLNIINALLKEGVLITAFDPVSNKNVKELIGDKIEYKSSMYQAIENKDALIIVTEWEAFKKADLDKVSSLLKNKAVFDGRNIFSLKEMKEKRFYYKSIGREIIY